MTGQTRLTVCAHVEGRPFHEETVVLQLATGEYFSLDSIGTRVWNYILRGDSLGEVIQALALDYDASPAQLSHDVLALADELVRHGLVVARK